MKNKRDYGPYLTIKFPDFDSPSKKRFFNSHGREITKEQAKRLEEINKEIEELLAEKELIDYE